MKNLGKLTESLTQDALTKDVEWIINDKLVDIVETHDKIYIDVKQLMQIFPDYKYPSLALIVRSLGYGELFYEKK